MPLKIARGTQNFLEAYARDVYKEALRWGAHSVVVAHSHPSGDPIPSDEDVAFTQRLIDVGKIAQIRLVDISCIFMIVGMFIRRMARGSILSVRNGWGSIGVMVGIVFL